MSLHLPSCSLVSPYRCLLISALNLDHVFKSSSAHGELSPGTNLGPAVDLEPVTKHGGSATYAWLFFLISLSSLSFFFLFLFSQGLSVWQTGYVYI